MTHLTPKPTSSDHARLVLLGAGGHAREVVALLTDGVVGPALSHVGAYDDGSPDAQVLGRIGLTHLGPTSEMHWWAGSGFAACIGSRAVRLRLAQAATAAGLTAQNGLSTRAHIGPDVRCGEGVVVFPMATVTTNIELANQVHVGRGAAIGHGSVLAEGVTVMPNASVSGNVTIGARSTIGTGAAVIQGVTIGADVMVGAGAVVVRDVPDGVTVAGVPAQVIG